MPLDLDVLCDPVTHASLEQRAQSLLSSGSNYSLKEGIPVFAPVPETLNLKYQRMYDRIAPLYDFAESAYQRFFQRDLRAFLAAELELRPHMRVLEVSIGTGANLRLLPQSAEIHGIDLSMGMLRACRRNLRRKHREAALYQGEAERLPFRDNTFDLVFHVGGINFFSDRRRALQEMIRVARPDSKIIVSDETEEVVAGAYQRIPFIKRFFQKRTEPVVSPVGLLPPGTKDIHFRTVNHGKLYCLTFRK
ncbi:MAG TPA: class I SAM-dependent methyltransferase [Candidatus Saccharimonadales bacterium]|nr:class I SAM-dependent methyltransferase [Candidatus Saccharimonadales bacterium]